jgi:hypothetical protein
MKQSTFTRAKSPVNINFDAMSKAFQQHVREKAKKAGSTIVYQKDNQLIEENPLTGEKKILKEYLPQAGR